MSNVFDQLESIDNREERLKYLRLSINSLPNDIKILIEIAKYVDGPNNDSILDTLRFLYRIVKNNQEIKDNLRRAYLQICPLVPGRGDVVIIADLVDHMLYKEAICLVNNCGNLPERWYISALFQGIRASFYDVSSASDGKLYCDILLKWADDKGINSIITLDIYRKVLVTKQLSYLFELRLSGWCPRGQIDQNILRLIEEHFRYQW